MHDLLYGLIAFFLSALFSTAGAGSGMAMIPILHFLGVDFNLAKAVGIFSGFTTTATSTFLNARRKVLEIRVALPLAISLLIFAPLGAQLSRFVDADLVKGLFAVFLIFTGTMMLFYKKEAKTRYDRPWILILIGAVVGTISGLLGVGGGNLLLPLLVMLGFDPKKSAVAVSFVVPFAAAGIFVSYLTFVPIDWLLLISVAIGAMLGAFLGNHLLHDRLKPAQVKKVIALILYLLAAKLLWQVFR